MRNTDSLSPGGATATVGLPGRLVESLGLHGQSFALVHEVVQLLTPLKDGLDGVVEDDLGVVEICL